MGKDIGDAAGRNGDVLSSHSQIFPFGLAADVAVDAALRRRSLTKLAGSLIAGRTDRGKALRSTSRVTQPCVMSSLIGSRSEQVSQRLSRICQALLALVRPN